MSEEHEEEPKIIIDEDWKSQVQREKDEAKATTGEDEMSESVDAGAEADQQVSDSDGSPQSDAQPEEMPPATLTMLVTNLATQAMGAMGHLPGEDGQPMPKNLPVAKHFIDLLGMLEEKTKGNLDQNEERYLGDALHQLRMLFVQAGQ